MHKSFALFFALFFIPLPKLFADLAAIHADQLPQETAVLAALDDAKQLEPYSRSWSNAWNYPVPKSDVADRLGKDLGFLRLAAKNHPENSELLLLTGLVARYAYNVDVENSHDTAIQVLDQAQRIAPADFRPVWFRATLLCQTNEMKTGADEFLRIESNRPWEQLPAAFWEDYTNCTTITNLPAHTLRAIKHLEKLLATNTPRFDSALGIAHQRIVPFDPKKEYDPKEVWRAEDIGGDPLFTSTTCGLRLRARGDWSINQLGVGKGVCVAYFSTGPYKATTGKLRPGVMVMARQPKDGESLQEFVKALTKGDTPETFVPAHCPAAQCIATMGVQPGMYKKNGDGKGRTVAFAREQPEFPGLIFESPAELPKPDGTGGTKFYRPTQTQGRIPGKLYYLVLLDTASSIEEPAMKDFDFFLQNLIVE